MAFTAPRKPRAHALSLAEGLLGPRAQTVDADRVGLDPLLRSHIHSMSDGIDSLLRRTDPIPSIYDSQEQAGKVQAGAQSLQRTKALPPRLKNLPPGAPPDGLLHSILGGLASDDVSVKDAVGTLESDLRSPAPVLTSPGRLGFVEPEREDSRWQQSRVMECDRCSVMGLQVRALAQSLAGISAKVFNWSSGLKSGLRRELADIVLQYALPCAHIDESIQHMCDELSSTRWESSVREDGNTKKQRPGARSSATWHWWDSDPAILGLTPRQPEGEPSYVEDVHPRKRPEHHAHVTASASPHAHDTSGADDLSAGKTKSFSEERIIVNVSGVAGATGPVQLQLVLYDAINDDDAVLAASSRLEVKKNEVASVEMYPDMTVEQNGVPFNDMAEPCFAIMIDQAATPDLVMTEEDEMLEVALGETIDIDVKAKKKKGFWSKS